MRDSPCPQPSLCINMSPRYCWAVRKPLNLFNTSWIVKLLVIDWTSWFHSEEVHCSKNFSLKISQQNNLYYRRWSHPKLILSTDLNKSSIIYISFRSMSEILLAQTTLAKLNFVILSNKGCFYDCCYNFLPKWVVVLHFLTNGQTRTFVYINLTASIAFSLASLAKHHWSMLFPY